MAPKHNNHLIGTTTIGQKGQVVIPADIRQQLKLKKGEKLLVFAQNGGLGLVRPKTIEPMIERLAILQSMIQKNRKK